MGRQVLGQLEHAVDTGAAGRRKRVGDQKSFWGRCILLRSSENQARRLTGMAG